MGCTRSPNCHATRNSRGIVDRETSVSLQLTVKQRTATKESVNMLPIRKMAPKEKNRPSWSTSPLIRLISSPVGQRLWNENGRR